MQSGNSHPKFAFKNSSAEESSPPFALKVMVYSAEGCVVTGRLSRPPLIVAVGEAYRIPEPPSGPKAPPPPPLPPEMLSEPVAIPLPGMI